MEGFLKESVVIDTERIQELAREMNLQSHDIPQHSIGPVRTTWVDGWAESTNFFAETSYSFANAFSVTFQGLNPFDNQVTTLTGQSRNGIDNSEYGVATAMALMPAAKGTQLAIKYSKHLKYLRIMYKPLTKSKTGNAMWQIGVRNINSKYALRLERHSFNTRKGVPIFTSHINHGFNMGAKNIFLNPIKKGKIKL